GRNYLCTSVFSARVLIAGISFAGIIILVPRILVAASVYTSITAAVEVAAGDGFIHAADRFADLAAALVDRGDGKSLTLLGVVVRSVGVLGLCLGTRDLTRGHLCQHVIDNIGRCDSWAGKGG